MMSEKDFSPLTPACVRALNDKIYEKRKAAALEIEKMVKDFAVVNNTMQIKKLLKILGQDFALSQNPHTRKGGLIGLAAMAIALGKETSLYIDDLIMPILACFSDSDARVRYYACESLYNVVKVARGAVLHHFNEIFVALSRLAADPEQHVKNGSELLDRLMKDIVTESSAFDLVSFMPLLRERIYTQNPFSRQFIISWVTVLDAVPDINMVYFLSELLDGLFRILEDPTKETKEMCETILGEFLRSIMQSPSNVDFASMINILITHAQSQDELLQFTAITWIKEFVNLSGRTMLPFAAGILTSILPCLSYEDDRRKKLRETSKTVNYNLMKLVTIEDDRDLPEGSEATGDAASEITKSTTQVPQQLDLPYVVTALIKQLMHSSVQTKVAVLGWLHHLFLKIPNKIFRFVEDIFTVLLKTLCDQSDQVVLQALEVLSEIVSSPPGKKLQNVLENEKVSRNLKNLAEKMPNMNPYFIKFMVNLLLSFRTDKVLLEERGAFIIRQLCVLLSAEDIYQTLSEILVHEDDSHFASVMVETLNTILLTSSELFELRTQLKDLKTEESCVLFSCLYRAWCHNPVATVALCLLTQNYGHASDLIRIFSNIEVTVEFLTEIDKLVQLIESPIFTYLRLELLDGHQNQQLVHALYGLLMILPQSEAFLLLKRRLECIPAIHFAGYNNKLMAQKQEDRKYVQQIKFDALLKHFLHVQEKHQGNKQTTRATALLAKGMRNMEI